jgi:hypothetical protein
VNRLTRTGWVAVLGVLLVGGTLTYGLVHLLARGHQEPSVVQAPQAPKLAPTPVSPQPVAPGGVAAAPAPGAAAEGFVSTLAWALAVSRRSLRSGWAPSRAIGESVASSSAPTGTPTTAVSASKWLVLSVTRWS